MVQIVLRTGKELGGIAAVIVPISMVSTMKQIRIEATVSDGTFGTVTV